MTPRRAALSLLLLAGCHAGGEAPAPRSAATPLVGPDSHRLGGEWVRADSPYVIAIDGVSADGKLAARYLNPQPINVSRAEWKQAEGRLTLLVELRDRLYPGSYYELTYDAVSDGLSGVYHHLGTSQDFDVSFYRREKSGEGAP